MSIAETKGQRQSPQEVLHPEAELVTVDFLKQLPGLQSVENVGNTGRTVYYWGARTQVGTEDAYVYVGIDDTHHKKAKITFLKGKEFQDREEWIVSDGEFIEGPFDYLLFQIYRSLPVTSLFSSSRKLEIGGGQSWRFKEMPLWKITFKNEGLSQEPRLKRLGDIGLGVKSAPLGQDLSEFAQVNQVMMDALKNPQRPVELPLRKDGSPDPRFFPFNY